MSRLADPWILALIPVAAALAWWVGRRRSRGEARLLLPDADGMAGIGSSAWTVLDRALPWMRGVVMALAIVALARPQWGRSEQIVSSLGVDIVIACDISGSMRCEDERPRNRLETARASLRRFVEGRPGDRIGLVAFGSLATTRCPLTLDHDMLDRFVAELDFAPAGEEGTALGMGLATAVNRLRESKAKSRIAVLLTDGRNNQGPIGPEAAAEAARTLGIKIYTIGVGSEGEVACPQDTPLGVRYVFRREDLDEDLLDRIARASGGRYFRATDPGALEEAFREIDRLEKSEIESRMRVLYTERFQLVLVPAGVLLLLEIGLATTRLRRIP